MLSNFELFHLINSQISLYLKITLFLVYLIFVWFNILELVYWFFIDKFRVIFNLTGLDIRGIYNLNLIGLLLRWFLLNQILILLSQSLLPYLILFSLIEDKLLFNYCFSEVYQQIWDFNLLAEIVSLQILYASLKMYLSYSL